MQVIVDDLNIGYDEYGASGKVLVLLHGWGANRKSMHGLAVSLSNRYKVIVPDVPGFGESGKPLTTWGLDEYAQFVMGFARKIGVAKVYGIIGHSNGGAIAIKLASIGFDCDILVLLAASGIKSRDKGKKLAYKVLTKTGRKATSILPKTVQSKIRSKWYDHLGSEIYHAPGMEKIFKKVAGEDLVIDSAMISAKTLLIYGSEDQATPPVYGRTYHEAIDGSKLDIIEGAGHDVYHDKPNIVKPIILDFL
jgi:pimeloyl-ACP methyl ester carboxylesterase